MKTRKKYIPTLELWRSMYLQPCFCGAWTLEEKVPISEIKIDKSLFDFQNEVSENQVNSMVEEFNIDYWIPITVNPNHFLLDGQHRLQTAKRLGLRYIDVMVFHEDIAKSTKGKSRQRNLL
jgi:ParB-like chromosome segregation protein Spo0J